MSIAPFCTMISGVRSVEPSSSTATSTPLTSAKRSSTEPIFNSSLNAIGMATMRGACKGGNSRVDIRRPPGRQCLQLCTCDRSGHKCHHVLTVEHRNTPNHRVAPDAVDQFMWTNVASYDGARADEAPLAQPD